MAFYRVYLGRPLMEVEPTTLEREREDRRWPTKEGSLVIDAPSEQLAKRTASLVALGEKVEPLLRPACTMQGPEEKVPVFTTPPAALAC